MLIGAFAAFAAARAGANPDAALLAAAGAGVAAGLAFAAFAVAGRADPILVGTAWNLVAAGGTAFSYRLLAGATGSVLEIRTLPPFVFGVPAAVVGAFLVPAVLEVFLRRTRPGLRLVAAGENPLALEAMGGSVVFVRTAASTLAGALRRAGGRAPRPDRLADVRGGRHRRARVSRPRSRRVRALEAAAPRAGRAARGRCHGASVPPAGGRRRRAFPTRSSSPCRDSSRCSRSRSPGDAAGLRRLSEPRPLDDALLRRSPRDVERGLHLRPLHLDRGGRGPLRDDRDDIVI